MEETHSELQFRPSRTFENLIPILLNNLDYFRQDVGSFSEKFVSNLSLILEHLQWIEMHADGLRHVAQTFDLDAQTPGNGYRSFLKIIDRCMLSATKLCHTIATSRDSIFFRAEHYCKELEAHVSVVIALRTGLVYLIKMLNRNKFGELFSIDEKLTTKELLEEYGSLDQTGFYGRCHGFYYCESMRKTLRGVGVIMASFSDLYEKSGGPIAHAAASVINGAKYIMNPELRAQQIVNVAQNASVEYVKAFWSLSETHFMKQVPSWLSPTPSVNKEIFVPAEPITLWKWNGECTVEIPAPSAHIPSAPVRCRLLSHICRQGQVENVSWSAPLSPSLLLHCHGGGFISQTPESHEIYLREWAKEVNAPLLSVDYSLSPEAPFPRALEEALLVYAWCLQNSHALGWSGERICLIGDSAGGNILLGTVLKIIDIGIRPPDAILCAYTPLILDMVPSPSRILCSLDPLLPLGFMLSCLSAYVGNHDTDEDEYTYEEPQEQIIPSVKEKKTSTVSVILDSSMTILKEIENMEVEDGITENTDTSESFEVLSNCGSENKSIGSNKDIKLDTPEEETKVDIPEELETDDDYITNFLNTCKSVSQNGQPMIKDATDQDENIILEFPLDLTFSWQRKFCRVTRKCLGKVSDMVTYTSLYKHLYPILVTEPKKPPKGLTQGPWFKQKGLAEKFNRLKISSRNPFISPYCASDSMLKKMPPVYILTLNFDPTLDDSVMFAKRLRKLGKPVCLDVLDGLPHGFLNFIPFSKEAHEGSNVVVKRLKQALQLST